MTGGSLHNRRRNIAFCGYIVLGLAIPFSTECPELLLSPQPVLEVPTILASFLVPDVVCHFGDFSMNYYRLLLRCCLHVVAYSVFLLSVNMLCSFAPPYLPLHPAIPKGRLLAHLTNCRAAIPTPISSSYKPSPKRTSPSLPKKSTSIDSTNCLNSESTGSLCNCRVFGPFYHSQVVR